jgi:hypothetical protein
VKQGELQGVIVSCYAQYAGQVVNREQQKADKDQGCNTGGNIEYQVCGSQPFTGRIGTDGAQYRSDSSADVGADREGEGVFISNLPGRQGGDDKGKGSVAGLHDDGGDYSHRSENEQSGNPGHCVLGQVHLV